MLLYKHFFLFPGYCLLYPHSYTESWHLRFCALDWLQLHWSTQPILYSLTFLEAELSEETENMDNWVEP